MVHVAVPLATGAAPQLVTGAPPTVKATVPAGAEAPATALTRAVKVTLLPVPALAVGMLDRLTSGEALATMTVVVPVLPP